MAKYEVMKPWHGVKMGQVFEAESLHPALKSHVRLALDRDGGELSPATPEAGTGKQEKAAKK